VLPNILGTVHKTLSFSLLNMTRATSLTLMLFNIHQRDAIAAWSGSGLQNRKWGSLRAPVKTARRWNADHHNAVRVQPGPALLHHQTLLCPERFTLSFKRV